MDTFSHGLWGGLVFGRENKSEYWQAFGWGMFPDLMSFGVFMAANLLVNEDRPDWSAGPPPMESIPEYVHVLYDISHSLVVFSVVFGLVFLIRRKVYWPMLAWGFAVLMDIPTHSKAFFATPFLWPISDWKFDGVSWSSPLILGLNFGGLLVGYLAWWYSRKRRA